MLKKLIIFIFIFLLISISIFLISILTNKKSISNTNNSYVIFLDDKNLLSVNNKSFSFWSIPELTIVKKINFITELDYNTIWVLGKNLAISYSNNKSQLKLWQLHDGKIKKIINTEFQYILNVSLSYDEKILSIGGQLTLESPSNTINLNIENENLIQRLEGANWTTFSNNGVFQASPADLATPLKLWNNKNGKIVHIFNKNYLSQTSFLAFSPDSQLLAASFVPNETTSFEMWNLNNKTLIYSIKDIQHVIRPVVFNPTSTLLALGQTSFAYDENNKVEKPTIELREAITGKLLKNLEGHSLNIISIAFSPNSHYLASSSEDNTIILWKLQ